MANGEGKCRPRAERIAQCKQRTASRAQYLSTGRGELRTTLNIVKYEMFLKHNT